MDDGYFADGLTEEILNALAQLPELLVTARTSAFAFKGQDLPVQEIAARLGVRHIVEGSVRRSGERLRVTAQLIRAEDGFHVWSENYDSTEQDTIAVQEDIAEKIALAMDVVLDDGKREAMRRAGLRDVEAFIAFQKGTELYEQAHGHERMIAVLRQANAHFEVVRRRVPGYVPAYIKHSDLYIHILMNEATGQSSEGADAAEIAEALPHAIADFEAAARLARNDAERDNAELDLAFISSDWRGIAARIERFIAQDGCEDSIWSDNIAVVTGYAERLQPRAEKQIQCNPLLTTKWQSAVRQKVWAGNPAGALEAGRQGARRAPGPWIYNQLVAALVAQGEFEQAEQTIAEHVRADFDALMNRMLVAAARGDRPAFDALLEEYETIPGESGYYDLMFSAWAGDRERANGIARRIDSHVFGSPALMTISMWCLCGAPFDLAVTPNLAANLEESGLPWPPPSPIRFPLKEQGFGERIALRLED
jgi:TolB-like protein